MEISKENANNNDTKVIELIQDLKEAIENGQFQPNNSDNAKQDSFYNENGNTAESGGEAQQANLSVISNLINVDNLSNQTFSYIINWLKQQQSLNEENKVIYSFFFCWFNLSNSQ